MVVLIVGFGSIAQKHYSILKKLEPECNVYALRSQRSAAVIPGVTNIYSYDELKEKPNFIIISSPTSNHYSDIEKCLQFGCPLFVEKPMLGSLQRANDLMEKVEQSGVIFYVACVLRFHPCLEYLKNNLADKRINEATIYCGSYLPEWRPGQDFRKSYSANQSMGGGVHLDLIHELDYTYWLFGNPGYSHSYATSKSSLKIEAKDSANYLLSYPEFNVNMTLNYFRRKPKREIEIVMDDTTWKADLLNYCVKDDRDTVLFYKKNTTIMDLYEKQLNYFLSNIAENKKCENDFKSGLDVLKICLLNNYAEQ